MKNAEFKFTKSSVAALPYAEGSQRLEYRDAELSGLVLRVSKTAKNYYLYRYDADLKKLIKERLGNTLELTPETARQRAMRLYSVPEERRIVGRDDDSPKTVSDLVERYRESYMPSRLRPASAYRYERVLKKWVIELWGSRQISSLTRREVRAEFERYGAKSPTQANKSLTVLGSLYSFAVDHEWVELNPASRITKYKEEPKTRVLSDDELGRFLTAINTLSGVERHYFWLLTLLGQRRTETLKMAWKHFDTMPGVWTIPETVTKNGRAHAVPLPPLALAHVEALKELTGGVEDCFYSWSIKHNRTEPGRLTPNWVGSLFRSLRKRQLGDIPTFTLHDLRRTMATRVSMKVKDQAKIKRILNHVDSSNVTNIYDLYSYNEVKLECLTVWEEKIREIVPQSQLNLSLGRTGV